MADKAALIDTRRGRCMAQILEKFEDDLEPRLPADVARDFKVLVRKKINAFAADVTEIVNLEPDQELNGAALSVRDSLHPDSALRPTGGSPR